MPQDPLSPRTAVATQSNPDVLQDWNRSYAVFVAFVASVGGFLFGYDLVIIGGRSSSYANSSI